jgi:hypothetical protein
VLQVIPKREPRDESSVIIIWLFAVTAVVLTTNVDPPVAIATLPDGAEPQVAGEVFEIQFEVVLSAETVVVPAFSEFVIVAELAVTEPEVVTDNAESEPRFVAPADNVPEILTEFEVSVPADIEPETFAVLAVRLFVVVVPKIVVTTLGRPILIELAVVEPMYSVPEVRVSSPKLFAATFIQFANKSPLTYNLAEGVVVPIPIFPVGIKRFPLVRVVFVPSSENRASPIVVVPVVNFANRFIVPEP